MRSLPLFLLTLLLLPPCAFAQKRELPPYPARELSWKKGEPFADDFVTDGATIRLVKDDGVTVAVFGYLEGDYVVAEVTVANETDRRVTVKPEDFFLIYWEKGGKLGHVFSLKPSKVANKVRGRAKWGNFFRAFAAGMARTTSTYSGSGAFSANGGSGTYSESGTITTPDRAALRRAAEANRAETESARAAADQVLSDALWANTLFPKTYVSGLVYFEKKKFEQSALYVMIDGTAYTFAFGGSTK